VYEKHFRYHLEVNPAIPLNPDTIYRRAKMANKMEGIEAMTPAAAISPYLTSKPTAINDAISTGRVRLVEVSTKAKKNSRL